MELRLEPHQTEMHRNTETASIEQVRTVVNKRIQEVIEEIRNRYEKNMNVAENLDFHNARHTENVVKRIETILEAMHKANPRIVSDRDIFLGKVAAVFHDLHQLPTFPMHLLEERTVSIPGNSEKTSADSAMNFMSLYPNLFFDNEKTLVQDAILSTEVEFDIRYRTVRAKEKPKNSIAAALVLADTGTAGMDGGPAFIEDGNALFRERFPNIFKETAAFDEKERTVIRQKILNWSEGQIQFVRGRQALFEEEISLFQEDVRPAIRKLFSKFEESSQAAQKKFLQRTHMSFNDLMADISSGSHHETLH